MNGTTTGPIVFTIGHSNGSDAKLLTLLEAQGIALVIDVRTAPYSRFTPQFDRDNLKALLGRRGIAYAFAGETLGGRPSDPALYKSGTLPAGHADYLSLVDYPAVARQPWFQTGIDRVIGLAAERRAALLCSEENPARCHRHHLIAQTLLERGVTVRHIRHSGAVETAAPLPPASRQLALLTGTA